jgi:hypothetical protein
MPWTLKNPAAADIAPDWLQPYCTQFLRKLSDQGYALVTLRSYDGAAALLCHEVSRRGLRSDQLVGATLTKARAAALGKMHPNRYDQKKYCLGPLALSRCHRAFFIFGHEHAARFPRISLEQEQIFFGIMRPKPGTNDNEARGRLHDP